jgi:hypothetical protein
MGLSYRIRPFAGIVVALYLMPHYGRPSNPKEEV